MGSGSGRGICLFYPTVAIFPLRMEELLGAKRPTPSHNLSNLTCRFPPKYYKKMQLPSIWTRTLLTLKIRHHWPTRTANYGNVQTLKRGVPTAVHTILRERERCMFPMYVSSAIYSLLYMKYLFIVPDSFFTTKDMVTWLINDSSDWCLTAFDPTSFGDTCETSLSEVAL